MRKGPIDYSPQDIEDLRRILLFAQGPIAASQGWDPCAVSQLIEMRVQTHMSAGHTAAHISLAMGGEDWLKT